MILIKLLLFVVVNFKLDIAICSKYRFLKMASNNKLTTIDLRSDTVTQPNEVMRQRMATAEGFSNNKLNYYCYYRY